MSSYSEGQTHQLMNALEAKGFTAAELTLLGQYPQLGDVKTLLHGNAEIVIIRYLINCDAKPLCQTGDWIETNWAGGQLEWNLEDIDRYLSMDIPRGLDPKLKPALHYDLNANVLDYLLSHPDLIPEKWKGYAIYFWGTTYRNRIYSYVRCLFWAGELWRECHDRSLSLFSERHGPAAYRDIRRRKQS